MITRTRRGITSDEDSDVYLEYVRETGARAWRETEDERYLLEYDRTVRHWEVADGP